MVIHYITSDPRDAVFELSKKRTQLKPYYIGEKRHHHQDEDGGRHRGDDDAGPRKLS